MVLEAIGDKGCFTVSSETFTVGKKPALPVILVSKPDFCLGETIELSTPQQDFASYAWTGPNGFTSTSRQVTIPVNDYNIAGSYFLTVSIFGCTSDVASITIPQIRKTPVPGFDISVNNPCTSSQSFTITNASADYTTLRWTFGDGAIPSSAVGDGPFTITYPGPGVRDITLQAESEEGCVVTLVKTLDVGIILDAPTISSNKPDFCLNDVILLSTKPQAGASYQWTGPDNFSSDQASVSIPVKGTEVAGLYTLIVSAGACRMDPVSIVIPPILKLPAAAFSSIPGIPAKFSIPVTIRFKNESVDADSYLWDFGDGATSAEANPSHTYTSPGEFDVSLTAFKSDVCSTSVLKGKFVIKATNTLFVPNTFTPNGDGINDEFVVSITNLVSYQISIFNRWGEQLFVSKDIFDNWKGLYKGEPLPVGTYYYVIDAVDLNGENVKQSGSVTIIR